MRVLVVLSFLNLAQGWQPPFGVNSWHNTLTNIGFRPDLAALYSPRGGWIERGNVVVLRADAADAAEGVRGFETKETEEAWQESNTFLTLKTKEAVLRAQLVEVQENIQHALKEDPLSIGIVGFGKFGQFLATHFIKEGNKVSVLSRSDRADQAAVLGAEYFSWEESDDKSRGGGPTEFFSQSHLDVVLISVSISTFELVMRELPFHLLSEPPIGRHPKGVLVVDVLSVKVHPRRVLRDWAPSGCDIVCSHPMFGPESGRDSWKDLPFVFEKVKVQNKERVERFLSIFETKGCTMVEMDAVEHDTAAANSQFATHLVGRLLEQLNLRPTRIDTKGFRTMLALKDSVAGDSFDLFYGLYKYNPNAPETLFLLRKALVDLEWRLKDMESSDRSSHLGLLEQGKLPK